MKKEDKLIRVFSGSQISVILLKGELENIGIKSIIQNDFDTGLSAGFFGGGPSAIDLFIQEFDMKEAEPIINEFLQNNPE